MLRRIYTFFRSIKLAIFLIVYLLLLAVVVGISGTTELLQAPLLSVLFFLFPIVLFMINLIVCAVSRIVLLLRAGTYFRPWGWLKIGPDLIHIAILLFLLGGLISHYGRVEGAVKLLPGEIVAINREYSLELLDFRIERYENNQAKQYVSEVQLLRNGDAYGDVQSISVNHPLSIGVLKIYQMSYDERSLQNAEVPGPRATVLQAVYDPGYPAIVWGGVVLILGMGLLLFDRMRKIGASAD